MAEEPKDYIDVEQPTEKDKVIKQIRALEQKFHVEGKPFDRYAAIIDFEDYCDDYGRSVQRAIQRKQPVPEFKKKWNFNEYGEAKRFKLIGEEPAVNKQRFAGVPAGTIVGVHRTYESVANGTKVSIFVSNEDLEAEKKK